MGKTHKRKQEVRALRGIEVYSREGQPDKLNLVIHRVILSNGTTRYLASMMYMEPIRLPDGNYVTYQGRCPYDTYAAALADVPDAVARALHEVDNMRAGQLAEYSPLP